MRVDRYSYQDIQLILDLLDDGVYITGADGVTLHINKAYEKITGLMRDQLIGRDIQELEAEGVFSPIITPSILKYKAPLTKIQKTSTGKSLEVAGRPVVDQDGHITYIVTQVKDVSKIEELNYEIEKQIELNSEYKEKLDQLEKVRLEEGQWIFKSPAIRRVVKTASQVARFDVPVLIQGETGVGKEVVAKYIQQKSERAEAPFVTVNCGAVVPSLIESEFFGYEGGAFTGASKKGKAGVFELADGGTLFLDEIGELPLDLQVKLLRVIQSGEVTRVGGTVKKNVDVRLICATNRNLESMADEGTFRKDLYYRLNVIILEVPPLRERKEDLEAMIMHFARVFNEKYKIRAVLSYRVVQLLSSYEWPGNIRELKNTIERMIVLSNGEMIQPDRLPPHIRKGEAELESRLVEMQSDDEKLQAKGGIVEELMPLLADEQIALKDVTRMVEEELIRWAVKKYGSKRKAAAALKISPSTLLRKEEQE